MRCPPAAKFGATRTKGINEFVKFRRVTPEIVRLPEILEHASRFPSPVREEVAEYWIGKHLEQRVAFTDGNHRVITECRYRCLIPRNHIETSAYNVGG